MVGREYTTFYLPLLKLTYILLKVEVYNAGLSTRGGTPTLNFFDKKFGFFWFFCYFFSRKCTIISDLGFDFERVLKLQQLLYFHSRTQALCKLSETIDDMK